MLKILFEKLFILSITTLLISFILRIWTQNYELILNKTIITSLVLSLFSWLIIIFLTYNEDI